MLKNDKSIGIGAIDCDIDRATCAKYGVSGYPTLKAIVGGKGKSYNGAREAEPIKEWITKVAANRGSKGGSAKCAQGVFKSKVKDATVPLCEEHYPDEKAKNDWLVLFYDSKGSDASNLKAVVNGLAADFGNDPPDMSKALKKQKKKRDRLTELAGTHGIKLKLPAKGPFGMDALVKVGAVCCDCNEDASAFCASSLRIGEEEVKAPQAFWVSKGNRKLLTGVELTAAGLAKTAVEHLGFAEKAGSDEL
jgi:hypothetical protein